MQLNSGFFYTIAMWKRNPINRVKEGFAVGILVFVSQLHQRFRDWWKKCVQLGLSWTKKYTRQNAVLTEEMLEETGARLEHSPRKSLARLGQQAQVSKTTARRAAKNLHLRPYKITQVQVIEEGDYGRRSKDIWLFYARWCCRTHCHLFH
jgi:hypothetical protein